MNAKEIIEKAAQIVAVDREATHGSTVQNHKNIAALWTAYLGVDVSAKQAALMLALLKIARTKGGSENIDDYVDLAGYAGCAGEIACGSRADVKRPFAVGDRVKDVQDGAEGEVREVDTHTGAVKILWDAEGPGGRIAGETFWRAQRFVRIEPKP